MTIHAFHRSALNDATSAPPQKAIQPEVRKP